VGPVTLTFTNTPDAGDVGAVAKAHDQNELSFDHC